MSGNCWLLIAGKNLIRGQENAVSRALGPNLFWPSSDPTIYGSFTLATTTSSYIIVPLLPNKHLQVRVFRSSWLVTMNHSFKGPLHFKMFSIMNLPSIIIIINPPYDSICKWGPDPKDGKLLKRKVPSSNSNVHNLRLPST